MIKKFVKSKILSTVISVAVSFFLVALFVYSASTISTSISTGGTLDVTATSTFNDGSGDYDFRIESDGQQHMFFMDAADNKIGIASSTPWGQLSVEAVQGVANASSPIFVIGDQGTSSPLFQIGAKNGNAVFASNAVFNEDGLDEDFRIESDGLTNAFVVDAGLNTVGIASTTPWGLFSVEAVQGTVNTNVPIFVVGDQGTSTPRLLVNANGRVGIATSTPEQEIGMTGDLSIGSGATTTVFLDSTAAVTGACLQMRGSNGTLYRAYLVATTTASEGVTAAWYISTGNCQ